MNKFSERIAAFRETADNWFDGSVGSIDRRLEKCSSLLATASGAVGNDRLDYLPTVAELTADRRALVAMRDDLLGASSREAGETPPGWRLATPVPALSAEPTDDERARTDATHRYIQQRYPDLEDTPGEGHLYSPGQRDDPTTDPDFAPNIIPQQRSAPPSNVKPGPFAPSHAQESNPNLIHDIPTIDNMDRQHTPNLDADSDQYWRGDQSTLGHSPTPHGQMSLFNETPHSQLPNLKKYIANSWSQADYDVIDGDDGWGGKQPSGDIDTDDGWGPGDDRVDEALLHRLHDKDKAHGWEKETPWEKRVREHGDQREKDIQLSKELFGSHEAGAHSVDAVTLGERSLDTMAGYGDRTARDPYSGSTEEGEFSGGHWKKPRQAANDYSGMESHELWNTFNSLPEDHPELPAMAKELRSRTALPGAGRVSNRWLTLEAAKFARENTDAIHDRGELAERARRYAATLSPALAEPFAQEVASHATPKPRTASAPTFTDFPDSGLFL